MENKRTSDRFQSFEEIPLYLDAKALVRTLGISLTTAYAMLSDPAFPAVKIGRKKLVRKEKLFEWIDAHENPNSCIGADSPLPYGSRFSLRAGGNP